MPNNRYEWKRFWLPRSEAAIPLSDGGYFPDPDSEYARWLNPEATTFELIDYYPCLVLLGEPGIGKSTAIEAACQHQNVKIKEGRENVKSLSLDLRSYGDANRLIQDLFESEIFKAWRSGSGLLVIFLDSYDECLLELKKLGQLLADQLKGYKSQISRLHLRIACRTAVWPSFLENELKKIYGDEAFGIYQLAPLRRIDVKEAAAKNDFDSDLFLNAVRDKNVISFAIKPITLRFLLNMYRTNETFDAKTNVDLYHNGCICLCEETNESRVASNQQGNLDKNQRLIIAARIAAVTMLSNREAVWSGIHQDEAPTQDFSIDSILGKCEAYNHDTFDVSYQDIRETLDTGLFSARGENRLGWAHQSYAEFLAAWYIDHHQTPIHVISELLLSQDQQNRRLIPQLQQTAAWLAGMREDVFDLIVESDTEALLTVDIGAREQTAKILVDHLLSDFRKAKIYDYYKYIDFYHRLQHAGLADQLRPYIKLIGQANETRDFISNARHAAIRIAEQCRVIEIQQDLVDLALDTNEDNYLRSSAAHAISDYGEEIYKQRLKPLALDAGSDDSDDEVKGYALWATWPNHISAAEVFDHLTKPKQLNLTGSYKIFIYSKLTPHLKPDDLPVALGWLKKRQKENDWRDPFVELVNQIIFEASRYLMVPDILRLFADVAFMQWESHNRFVPIENGQRTDDAFASLEDDTIRRDLLSQVVHHACERPSHPDFFIIYQDIAKPADFDWILNKLNLPNSHSREEDEMWAKLLRGGFDIASFNHVDAILTSSQLNNTVRAAFKYFLEPIDLDSDETAKLKEYYKDNQGNTEDSQIVHANVPLEQQVDECLTAFEAGVMDAFWQLLYKLSLKSVDDLECINLCKLDISKLPGWLVASKEVQNRIVKAANLYLREYDQLPCNWVDSDRIHLPFIAGCQALYLLMHTDQAQFNDLSADCWGKWAASVVAYPNEGSQDAAYITLVQLAYQKAPIQTISALESILGQAKHNQRPIDLERFVNCWDDKLNTLIVNQLIDQPEYTKYHESLLENLIERREANAIEFALNLIRQAPAPPLPGKLTPLHPDHFHHQGA
jgi:predicted NACHT family NTPase